MLYRIFDVNNLDENLVSKEDFCFYPKIHEREKWDSISCEIKNKFVENGNKYINFDWPSLPATKYIEFFDTGNRSNYEKIYFKRRYALSSLVVAECIENKGRYIKDIINGIWTICEESTWVLPAHLIRNRQEGRVYLLDKTKPYIDLFSAQTAAQLSWIYFLLKEVLDEKIVEVCKRIEFELEERIIEPYLATNSFWWMWLEKEEGEHVINWTPWCTSNVLNALLIVEKDYEKRKKGIIKAIKSLDAFLDEYNEDGGCDEGTSYWSHAGGALFDAIELLEKGIRTHENVFGNEKIKNIGKFIYRAHICNGWYINFADGPAKPHVPGGLLFQYGKRIKDEKLKYQGSFMFKSNEENLISESWFAILRTLRNVFLNEEIEKYKTNQILLKKMYLPDTQVMSAREKQDNSKGFYLACKGGHNNESHNHNDIGNYIIYYNGKPIIIDIGVGEYTSKTFSSKRYEIWTMQSKYHNVPLINGYMQKEGEEYRATNLKYREDETFDEYLMDISKAYPKEVGIIKWERTFKFDRTDVSKITIKDEYKLKKPAKSIELTLMTPREHIISENGYIEFSNQSDSIRLYFDKDKLDVISEKITIDDKRLIQSWQSFLYRITFKIINNTNHGEIEFRFSRK